MSSTTILAIETSCDETGVAIVRREGESITILANKIASQIDIHRETGGVVPEVAAREHVTALPVLLRQATAESKIEQGALDAIAVTLGPGLAPALSVGVTAAQALAYAWGKPIIPVHHLEGHMYSALLSNREESPTAETEPALLATHYSLPTHSFPALALIVSGGHTQLVFMPAHLTYEVVGATRDDAAGEAFDKVARLLGLPYPGGPHLSHLAEGGNPDAFKFARPMLRSGDLDFSFSGLKTEVLYTLQRIASQEREVQPARAHAPLASPREAPPAAERSEDKGELGRISPEKRADIAASFEQAVVDTLIAKTRAALERTSPRVLLAAGGVLANRKLRRALARLAHETGTKLRLAPLSLCGDNAVMIGQAALFACAAGRTAIWQTLDARPRWPLQTSDSS